MKNWLQIGVFLIGMGLAQGQGLGNLEAYLGENSGQQVSLARDQVAKLVTKLNAKSKKSDRQFLMGVFNLTHRQFLKEYRQYSGFTDLFESGQYDCVTATALYSLLFAELGYEHQIIETKYHIFMLVKSADGEFLIESTDPIDGFVYEKEKIKNRIAQYMSDDELLEGQINKSKKVAAFQAITPDQLTGLLYYNQCVKYFNESQLQLANHFLLKAKHFYDSPRMDELEHILRYQMAAMHEVKTAASERGRQISQRQEP